MDEARRLDYLHAMGVTQYVARRALPGAKPSPVREILAPAQASPEPVAALSALRTMPSRPLPPAAIPPAAVATSGNDKPVAAGSPAFQCQLAIWTTGDLLLLADAPRLDNIQLSLLRNILHAIGRNESLPETRQFLWPLPQRKDRTLTAARDHFQGMLDGGFLREPGLRHILCFGEAPLVLLGHGDEGKAVQHYGDWPVTGIASLQQMIEDPATKRDAWRALQLLVRT